jgi:hypothetical protein
VRGRRLTVLLVVLNLALAGALAWQTLAPRHAVTIDN